MTPTRLFPSLLAATLALTAGPFAPAAFAGNAPGELRDVPSDHWARHAILTLADKYHVLAGFSDGTFRGKEPVSRYELAAVLAKVMARMEQRAAETQPSLGESEPAVSGQDWATLTRLQREFRDELQNVRARLETLDSRLGGLEKRLQLSGALEGECRGFVGLARPDSAMGGMGDPDYRLRSTLFLDAALSEEWDVHTQLAMSPLYGATYLRDTSGQKLSATEFFIPESLLRYRGSAWQGAAGLGALRNHLPLASSQRDPFKRNQWSNALGGYGFVGTPGLKAPGKFGTVGEPSGQWDNIERMPFWLAGTDVIADVLDPNNSQAFGPTGELHSAAQGAFGPVTVGAALAAGALSSPYLDKGAYPLPASLPQLRTRLDGVHALGTVGLDVGPVRLSAYGLSKLNGLLDTRLPRKVLAGRLEWGTDALSLNAEVEGGSDAILGNNFSANKASVRFGSANLLDTGFGLFVGGVSGNFESDTFEAARSLLAGQADYTSLGAVLRTPSVYLLPSFTLAAQNTAPGLVAAGLTGNVMASGLTVSTQFPLWGSSILGLEYSVGKFNKAGDANDYRLSGNQRLHEQLSVMTRVNF